MGCQIVELNVKRTRNLDLNQILSTLNDDQRSPDFFNPGHALFLKTNLYGNEETPPMRFVIRELTKLVLRSGCSEVNQPPNWKTSEWAYPPSKMSPVLPQLMYPD